MGNAASPTARADLLSSSSRSLHRTLSTAKSCRDRDQATTRSWTWTTRATLATLISKTTSNSTRPTSTTPLPTPANFLDVLEGNPDLYGPFWIATTVVLVLFLGGTISQYLSQNDKAPFAYDFTLLSGAAGLIYGYTLFIPVGLFLALRYFGSELANLLECWSLYGYSNLVWVVVAFVSWSPLEILNWAFVIFGFGMSVAFLLRNLYPVLSATDRQTSKILLIVVVMLHAGLALAIKILFFAHGSPVARAPGEGGPDKGGDSSKMMFF